MAKSFHSYEKRRKELAKKKKREEKLARKRAKGKTQPESGDEQEGSQANDSSSEKE